MTCLSRTLGLIFFFAIAAHAQSPIRIEVVGYGGFPLNKTLQPETCCGIRGTFVRHETDKASYTTGVSAGAVIRYRIHVSFGAMYMPVSYRETVTGPGSQSVTRRAGTSWEFPLLGHYRWGSGNLRPFTGGGLILHNRTTGGQKQAPGPVLSGGFEWSGNLVLVRPELRYIHYPSVAGSSFVDVGRAPNQFQLLIGIGLRK